MKTIIQIIPAPPDLYAYYEEDEKEVHKEYGPLRLRVVCLALVENEVGTTWIEPMTIDGAFVDLEKSSNFSELEFLDK